MGAPPQEVFAQQYAGQRNEGCRLLSQPASVLYSRKLADCITALRCVAQLGPARGGTGDGLQERWVERG